MTSPLVRCPVTVMDRMMRGRRVDHVMGEILN
jgi:hypothetical protein